MKNLIQYIALAFFLLASTSPLQSIAPISIEAYQKLEIETQSSNSLKGLWKKILPKMEKRKKLLTLAAIGMMVGIASLFGLFYTVYVGGSYLTVAVLAILADILSIIAIAKARKDRKNNRKALTMGIIGLITGLLTGLLPLTLFILILLAVR